MTAIAVGEAILLLSATLCGLAVMLWKRCGRSAERKEQSVTRQSSDQITVSGTSGNQLLLQRARVCSADTVENSSFEALTRIVADLKSKLSEKEETNRPQQRDLKSNVVCSPAASSDSNPPVAHSFPQNQVPTPSISQQHGNPASDCPVSRKRHNNSSPAVLDFKVPVLSGSFSANILQKKISRSISEPTAQLRPSVPKLQRRHSSALTTLSNNRFTLLADLPEESELLVP
ncbi:uncharacterized protein LOC119912961 [Micropterus salmoides]|uniref:uncharacterized protein LOC119912961 n=1 Tax=Micropterus salmoides TaxID=27706 RepID=UPI0018ECE518|nr:uncharacterized protein LOC119912961 [Micropterus salmoides]